jgi:polyisoprenyl-phosphate glycosyltransferase
MMNTQTRKHLIETRQCAISCIVPIHNEQEVIAPFLEALTAQLKTLADVFEIIVVDDGSTDQSAHLVEQAHETQEHIKLLSFSRNFGKETAIAAGLKHCTGDVTVIIDADFQHPVKYIGDFLEKWGEGYDMAYGLHTNRSKESFIKRNFSRLFYRMLDMMTDVKIPRHAGDFRLLDKSVVKALAQCTERARFMKGLYAWVGYKTIAVPFEVAPRAGGTASYRYAKLTNLAITGFISFSDVPLRIWSLIGAFICGFSFLIILYVIIDTLFFGIEVPGYATLLITVIFFGGVQLLSIGILGEYISRVFNEVKHRPQYIIQKQLGFDAPSDEP